MIQALVKGRGGAIETYFLSGRAVSCAVSIYDADGVAKVTAAACTVDPVDTDLAVAAEEGDRTITLTTSSDVTTARRYLLGNEDLTVKSLVGNVITLWAPLRFDHDVGEQFVGTRVSYVAGPSVADDFWFDGYAEFTPDASIGEPQTETVDCLKRKIPPLIGLVDIRKSMPKDGNALSDELDLFVAFQDARNNFLMDLGGKRRAQLFIGVDEFRSLVADRFWLDRWFEFGQAWTEDMERKQKEYFRRIDRLTAVTPTDANQDGVSESPAGGAEMAMDLELM